MAYPRAGRASHREFSSERRLACSRADSGGWPGGFLRGLAALKGAKSKFVEARSIPEQDLRKIPYSLAAIEGVVELSGILSIVGFVTGGP
jgi:hypothetical protein